MSKARPVKYVKPNDPQYEAWRNGLINEFKSAARTLRSQARAASRLKRGHLERRLKSIDLRKAKCLFWITFRQLPESKALQLTNPYRFADELLAKRVAEEPAETQATFLEP